MSLPESPLSRRTLLHAAGAVAVAGYVSSLTSPAQAADASDSANQVATYSVPDDIAMNDSFAVKVRTPGGTWKAVDVYRARFMTIDPRTGSGTTQNSSMAYFDFSGEVQVSVTYTQDTVKKARIRPTSYDIAHKLDKSSGTLTFSLTEPRNLSIEFNEDLFDNLQLFAGAIDTNPPSEDDPDVIYFGPGVHAPSDGKVTVPSGKTVYLAGGAVLKARVVFDHVQNAKLLGRGLVYEAPNGGACGVDYCENIEIDGVTMMLPWGHSISAGQTKNLTIRNLRSMSATGWGDGIDLFCCQDVVIDGVFMRNSDDCVAVYNHRWDFVGDSSNIVVKNSTLWADVAHPVNIGTHGNTDNPETIENVTFKNIDILDHREPQLDYQGCFALNAGDSNLIRNVRIEDVRVEDFRWGQLINMRVMFNKSYNTSAGRGIEMVYIKDLSYTGTHASTSHMVGYDADHAIKDVIFENLVINGTLVSDTDGHASWYKTSDFVPMYTNEHVSNLKFVDSGASLTAVLPAISSADSVTGNAGSDFAYTIEASNHPYAFAATGLPDGLTVNKSTGVISGKPTDTGTSSVELSATNAVGTGTRTLTLVVG
ncbi:putative Ig domain-containing protein [Streptomyces sp. NBC_00620]|uniref:putative Ig domain-containing protein n=1 Tax=Streptomyces sp. NBC_00620 TaxID=2903666 RepID=UPI002258A640|nr:putative Ig domain-containing protein [Streptomyces sp. NBC_00620]MCX4977078.1 putative Ig domain-containing protein [Streptomyces sp. NBC_00620]